MSVQIPTQERQIPTHERTTARAAVETGRRVILLEFNELSPALMDTFIAQGYLPHFKRLREICQVFTTDAEEVAPTLDPWIQWVTVHSGLSFDEHGIHHLGDGHKLQVKSLWDFVSDKGLPVWVCGSMNIKYDSPIRGAVVPDPWTTGVTPYPEEFAPYYAFVQHNVQEYTNEGLRMTAGDYLRFLSFMMRHGLSAHTVTSIVRQLATERMTGRGRWKRAAILDKLQRDIFLHYLRKTRPALATFFLNSTAHLQHVHWRNMDPEPFKVKPTDAEQAEYQHAVRFGYIEMDRILADIVAAAPADAVIVFATALSQQPCLLYEDIGGKTFYRPRIGEKLLDFLGITECRAFEPVMSEQFHLRFDSASVAEDAAKRLGALRIDGKEVMTVELRDGNVFAGCTIFRTLDPGAVLKGGPNGTSIEFFRLFYQVENLKSGMHHPDGLMWIRVPGLAHRVYAEKVSLRDVAPTLLALLGIEKPSYMSGKPLLAMRRAAA
jgi:Type I phosphodiesterase / nucleotide pyrophosphatase